MTIERDTPSLLNRAKLEHARWLKMLANANIVVTTALDNPCSYTERR